MKQLIEKHDFVLMEAAIVEPIRRGNAVPLDPLLVHGQLVYSDVGRRELRRLYQQYARTASAADVPILLCTPTWRTNRERVQQSGVETGINRDAAEFMRQIQAAWQSKVSIRIGGLIGCKNDAYLPAEALGADEAEEFHRWQIEELTAGDVDFLFAATLPSVDEALGIARAMSATGKPYIISFVINKAGRLLDQTSLSDAIRTIDADVPRKPLAFMVNCAYPTFLCAEQQPPELFQRLVGIQANASSREHHELDGSSTLLVDDVGDWGDAMVQLHRQYGLKILGGCCGTNDDHLRYFVEHLCGEQRRTGDGSHGEVP